ncbi:unnamed protein product [Larinioides sclopetarius]|uniref:Uncharacterized protein n=1 Tax=Larinioides sclopetarius TaxID=280406 RepID=A0AAV1YY33_9ARAC
MHFTVLFTLFGIIFASYDYPSEMESGDFESALCDNEEGEMSRVVSDCYDKINIQKYASIITQCYAGLNGEINGQLMRDWYCAHSMDEIMKADECSDEMVIAEKGEEFLKEIAELLGECVESKLSNDKKRK